MNKVTGKILNHLDVLSFILLITIKLSLCGKELETGYFSYKVILPPILASVLLLASFSFLFNKKNRIRFLLFCNFIISIFIIADLNYFRYFKDVISIPIILNGFQLGAVKSSVGNLFKVQDLFYALDLTLFFYFYSKSKYEKKNTIPFPLRLIPFSCVFFTGAIMNAMYFINLSKEQPRLISTMYNKVYISKRLGDLNYHYLDAVNSISNSISKRTPVSQKTQEKVKTFLQSNSEKPTENLKGVGEDKNLLVIQVEALQSFPINQKINGVEITPNLNKWLKKSAYFNNYFYQTAAGGTSDAEFLSNNSLYPTASGSVTYLYTRNEFNAMPKAFLNKGYTTVAFHGFRESFWNRNIMYPKYGFETFYGEKSFDIDEEIGLGLSDKSFFNQSIEKIKTLQQPYYSFMVTLTSHFPYEDVKKYGNFNVGDLEGTLVGNYLKSIHYTDEQLGIFLNELEKEGITKNSIIALYGDHYAIPRDNEKDLAKFLNKSGFTDLEWMELQKVPMFIHFPEDRYKGTYSVYGGQIDLYPTLANIFNLPASNMMGKDLFNSKEGKVIFRNSSFTDGKVFYLSPQDSYYNIKSGEKLKENDVLKNLKESSINQLEYSDLILKHNLIKKFNVEKNE
ncbi:phosphoglycerol transferase MdoB-like AlkP superfamily enzyme [Clostridium tetanomorphum]|uniref:LTA synthase family protein n=1 Tax=Clostridium tetanomorphum TaxID=1553 RepID=A0A923ECZ9_CLOTT|nr:LTA synthase family protein [Clostridium tetanomorphum]KAJ50621.1 alkaline phosphatase [Clostridium tetanomorphum DSM 665]MBC2399694.1 LTA synthase family protein [Clostridium tetanomorphum]MBP1862696.1 phosphoglycerol transferase MdoB-like AlkP superfamily enzyme [Clostridium tetanomorphum]NRS85464.1 phosphoglycerol transferase MdoB-like AlkP superfamily enzyme [Clostridium tetanomorphum]NRZ98577.1 phosphoglycerol transferase MdoB-like AlkP superfamily enzyme [Clostridium tetanomorphum]